MTNSKFEVLQEGWVLLSPYGEFAHAQGIQRVTRQGAEKLVRNFNSVLARLGRYFSGVPFYVGHPDCGSVADKYPDRKAYGWVMKLEARDDGIYGLPKWSKAGVELIENGHYKFLSVFWDADAIGSADGRTVYEPCNLISVGLTNMPNLPVRPLANSATGEITKDKALLTGEQPGANGLITEPAAKMEMPVEPTPIAEEPKDELVNDTIIALVDTGIVEGRVLPNERELWISELAGDFENSASKLAKSAPRMKVQRRPERFMERTRQAGGTADVRAQICSLVNEKQVREGLNYDEAWFAVKAEHPEWF